MKFLVSDGIVIRKSDYGEADRMLTLFTQRYGKIQLNVKGIRKSKRRDKNAVDILALSKFVFYRKGERFIVSSFESKESFWGIRSRIEDTTIVMYLLSVLNAVLVENQRNSDLYDYVLKVFKYIDENDNKVKNCLLVCYFLKKIIEEEGIFFEISEGEFFDIENSKFTTSPGDCFFSLSKKEKDILENISNGKTSAILMNMPNIVDIKKVISIFEKYINYHLQTNLNFKHFLGEDLKNDKYSQNNGLYVKRTNKPGSEGQ
jgi:DNA repair protein RecO (recombination protein O)